jgi:DNA segregation ATPase FtsK/SpoIIIE-like protein
MLIGMGDGPVPAGRCGKPARVQGSYVCDEEIAAVVNLVRGKVQSVRGGHIPHHIQLTLLGQIISARPAV